MSVHAGIGGAFLTPSEALDTPHAPKQMAGSLMIFETATYAETRAIVEEDVYWTENVVRPPFCFATAGVPHLTGH